MNEYWKPFSEYTGGPAIVLGVKECGQPFLWRAGMRVPAGTRGHFFCEMGDLPKAMHSMHSISNTMAPQDRLVRQFHVLGRLIGKPDGGGSESLTVWRQAGTNLKVRYSATTGWSAVYGDTVWEGASAPIHATDAARLMMTESERELFRDGDVWGAE